MKEEHNPSWGMIGISRVQHGGGGPRLFNSPVTSPTTIRIRVHTASRKRDLCRNWIHANSQIVEVELSHAQFAEFITTPNTGDGVPCTITWREGVGNVEHEPEGDEQETFREEFSAHTRSVRNALTELRAVLGDKATRAVKEALDKVDRELKSNLPFVATQFGEHMDARMAAAKAEFDGFVTHAVHAMGLQALQSGNMPTLPAGDGVDKATPEAS